MHLELGPVPAGDVQQWARFARRILCELRSDPGDLTGVATEDFLRVWGAMIDRWEHHAALGSEVFRWTGDLDVELAEYLLHGADRCLQSKDLNSSISRELGTKHGPFTMQIVQALVDGLSAEGRCQEHLCDQVRASLGDRLDH